MYESQVNRDETIKTLFRDVMDFYSFVQMKMEGKGDRERWRELCEMILQQTMDWCRFIDRYAHDSFGTLFYMIYSDVQR